jgi:hypothetical protein
MFWELTAKTGYFCHAAVGVPEREYEGLKADLVPIFRDFVELTGRRLTEFKHGEFKRLDYRARRKLALRLRDALTTHGAFVAGFYTPVRSLVLERVREKLMDEAEELPEDHEALCEQAAAELKAEHAGPGQAGAIQKLLWLPVVGIANLLASLDSGYKIFCDPRDKKEDKVVRAAMEGLIERTGNFRKIPGIDLRTDLDLYFRGIDFSRTSEQEPGLQIADLVVGEVCAFFKANEELLTYGATRRLVTPTSVEPANTVTQIGDRVFKTGVLHKMPADLQARLLRPDPGGRTVLPFFRKLFAAGILTCYSVFGQPRDIMVFEGLIWDQCE